MNAAAHLIALTACLAPAAMLGSCGVRPPPSHASGAPAVNAGPFAPTSIRIHPLTRLDRDAKGRVIIACHIEFRDTWGDTCKGVGRLRIELYRTTGGRGSTAGVQDLRWDIDLADLSRNAALYDPATRTYRLPLGNLPGWVEQVSAGPDRPDDPRITLRAALVEPGADGADHVLEAEYTIEP